MPERLKSLVASREGTYKIREAEGVLDLYFYRKLGFILAAFFAKLKMTPTMVTLLGGVFGLAGGHLYFYSNLPLNALGMCLHVFANLLDNADGQLARLLNQKSRSGRIIDSLVDHAIFVNIYVHLALRLLVEGAAPTVCFLVIAAGVSHALQGAAADYFRNAYLYFVKGRSRADWDSSVSLKNEYQALSWRTDAWNKFLIASYLSVTLQQEFLSPKLRRLRDATVRDFADQLPDWLRQRYGDIARPMLRGWGLLMTNTRMFFLFLFLFLKQPVWFFWLELTIYNLVLLYLLARQERMARSFLEREHFAPEVTTALL